MGALGKAYYKGGFEQKINKREAMLILQLRSVALFLITPDAWNFFFGVAVCSAKGMLTCVGNTVKGNLPKTAFARIIAH